MGRRRGRGREIYTDVVVFSHRVLLMEAIRVIEISYPTIIVYVLALCM